MNPAPLVDIIISTYRRGDKIDATLSSIRQNSYTNFAVWVLDQSEDDQTEQCVLGHAAQDQRIHYHRSKLNGIAAKRNAGITFGNAPYILFTNDDCRVAPDWIASMVAELEDPQTWIVFGQVLPEPSTEPRPESAHPAHRRVVLGLKDDNWRQVYEHNPYNLGFGHGHNMAVRRDCFAILGGFDELIGAGGPLGAWDERDFGYRALIRDARIVYTPNAVIYHNHWLDWIGVAHSSKMYAIGAGAAVTKYMRCGDPGAFFMLLEWVVGQGLRQVIAGAIKTRSWKRMRVGIIQIVYPWVGMIRGLAYPIDRSTLLYKHEPGLGPYMARNS